MKKFSYKEYINIYPELVDTNQSFEIYEIDNLADVISISNEIEKYIESKNMTCRVYTKNRIVSAFTGLIRPQLGIFALASIAAHSIMTFNPDYKIARDIVNNRILVIYK